MEDERAILIGEIVNSPRLIHSVGAKFPMMSRVHRQMKNAPEATSIGILQEKKNVASVRLPETNVRSSLTGHEVRSYMSFNWWRSFVVEVKTISVLPTPLASASRKDTFKKSPGMTTCGVNDELTTAGGVWSSIRFHVSPDAGMLEKLIAMLKRLIAMLKP